MSISERGSTASDPDESSSEDETSLADQPVTDSADPSTDTESSDGQPTDHDEARVPDISDIAGAATGPIVLDDQTSEPAPAGGDLSDIAGATTGPLVLPDRTEPDGSDTSDPSDGSKPAESTASDESSDAETDAPDLSDIAGATTGPLTIAEASAASDAEALEEQAPEKPAPEEQISEGNVSEGNVSEDHVSEGEPEAKTKGDAAQSTPGTEPSDAWEAPAAANLKEPAASPATGEDSSSFDPAGFDAEATIIRPPGPPSSGPVSTIPGSATPGSTEPDSAKSEPADSDGGEGKPSEELRGERTVQIDTGDPTSLLPKGSPTGSSADADATSETPLSPERPGVDPTVPDLPTVKPAQPTILAEQSVAMANAANQTLENVLVVGDPKEDAAGGGRRRRRGKANRSATDDASGSTLGGDRTAPVAAGSAAAAPRKQKRRRGLRVAGLLVFLLAAVFLGAWAIDSLNSSGSVIRNTTLGDTPIGGLDRDELDTVFDQLDAELASSPLTVSVGDTDIETDAATLGARIDRDAVADEALAVGREGSVLEGPVNWVRSFTSDRTIEPIYTVDDAAAEAGVAAVMEQALDDPVEPELAIRSGEIVLVPGSPGTTVDRAEIAGILPSAVAAGTGALQLSPIDVPPVLSDDEVQAAVDEASEATAEAVVFRVLDKESEVASSDIRTWVTLDTSAETTWAISTDSAFEDLKPLFPALGSEDQQASFSIVDNVPIIIPASETVICCDIASIEGIRAELLTPLPPPPSNDTEDQSDDEEATEPALRVISLEPEIVGSDDGVAELESLGVIEEVSTFTTNHACCANRVTNIQRFADLMRGVIIRPGEEFSLNGHVGRRTTENGFVADGAIVNGIIEPQVGGGVSQFATTFFNASFFAGIDFNEYQSHSLYIPRYPRGREATISHPKPDLSVTNTTEYGILVWTEYTGTSITVTFYSTKHIEVEALALRSSPQGAACTRVTTPRTRTYPDGTVVEDSVFAVYRPGEGFDCNGNSTRPEEEEEE